MASLLSADNNPQNNDLTTTDIFAKTREDNSKHDENKNTDAHINLWRTIIATVIFLTILSWYDFLSASFTQGFSKISDEDYPSLNKTTRISFGYAILATAIASSLYFFMYKTGKILVN